MNSICLTNHAYFNIGTSANNDVEVKYTLGTIHDGPIYLTCLYYFNITSIGTIALYVYIDTSASCLESVPSIPISRCDEE